MLFWICMKIDGLSEKIKSKWIKGLSQGLWKLYYDGSIKDAWKLAKAIWMCKKCCGKCRKHRK